MKIDAWCSPAKMYAPQNYADEDSLPVRAAPRPLLVGPALLDCVSDLDVSLTPDKMSSIAGILKKQERSAGEGGSGRTGRRQVRFNTGCDSKGGLAEGLLPELDAGREPQAGPGNEQRPRPLEPTPFPRAGGRKPSGLLGGAERPLAAFPLCRVEDPADRPLAVPQYNTTLALGQELLQLKEAAFDARKAATDQMKRSSVTRQCLEGKVTEGLNVPKDVQRYRGLVSLEVPVDEVLNTAIQEKMVLVKPRAESKKPVTGAEGPDVMVLYQSAELLTEEPHLAVDGLPTLKVQAQPRLANSSFDLYRKLQQWNA
ncbi:protein phosphatase 1 regulatory subunit 35 [Leucoraja erinacea]|uniref:protein phosphatase 1 regulatory subunit 35 n=1 Tax=Leucoraja erinaceus TaxID=7782 RepID=UPI0024548AE4|nr:protein phosphatase 1 regulatory subunit 35 [Leucoraja erinacea]